MVPSVVLYLALYISQPGEQEAMNSGKEIRAVGKMFSFRLYFLEIAWEQENPLSDFFKITFSLRNNLVFLFVFSFMFNEKNSAYFWLANLLTLTVLIWSRHMLIIHPYHFIFV